MRSLSIRTKLLVAFVGVIAAGYWIVVSTLGASQTRLLEERALQRLEGEASAVSSHLVQKLRHLAHEIAFLSTLEVMDDMIADDLDRRIAQILEKKRLDLGEGVALAAVDLQGRPVAVAASRPPRYERQALLLALMGAEGPRQFVLGRWLIFSAPLQASFDPGKRLGWLLLFYPLPRLKSVLPQRPDTVAWIVPPPPLAASLAPLFPQPSPRSLQRDYLYILHPLQKPLKGWKLGYAERRAYALETVERMRRTVLTAFGVMLGLVALLTLLVDRRIVEPVRELAKRSAEIVRTRNYGLRVGAYSADEVGELARHFNNLMAETEAAFEKIGRQKEEHAATLSGLMAFFATMLRCETKEAVLATACDELARLTGAEQVRFEPGEVSGGGEDEEILPIGEGRRRIGTIRIRKPVRRVAMRQNFYESITRMISLQIERIELLQSTREALESKSRFFSALSHELRTPLVSILSLSQYRMVASDCDGESARTFGQIEASAAHLLHIINDILTLAKAEAGRIEPVIAPCDPVALCEACLEMVEPLAEAKGIALTRHFPDRPVRVATDAKLFRHVVINLLSNAVKYTQKGRIDLTLRCRKDRMEILIADTGVGIAPEALEHVFEEFYREDRAMDHESGSGLGLALSRRIAELLGGELRLQSEGKGRGTLASFTLFVSCSPPPGPSG